jgi:hypothetical protein
MTTIISCQDNGIETWIHKDVDEKFISKTFSKKALLEDLEYLITEMHKRHPVFDKITNEKDISTILSNIKKNIHEDMSRQDFFRVIGKLNPVFKDGHSFIFPLLAEGNIAKKQDKRLFPFGVFVRGNSLYVNRTYTNTSSGAKLKKGSKIVAINGLTGEMILNKLAEYGHGETATLRMHMSSVFFPYWLNAIYDWESKFEVVFEYGENIVNIVVSNPEAWKSDQEHTNEHRLEFMPDHIAYLKLGSFDVDEETGYYQFVEDAFRKIREEKLSKLIIDVRGNTGGQTKAGAEVIKYLTRKKINQASAAIEKLSENNNGIFGYKGEPGEILKMDVKNDALIEPVDKSERFKGEVILLIDELTFSAGIVFATTIQDHKLAKLVGRPTGGHANQTGNINTFHLPNTRLLVLVPSRYITRVSGDTSRHKVQPDVLVYEGKTSDEDKTLKVALELFGNN